MKELMVIEELRRTRELEIVKNFLRVRAEQERALSQRSGRVEKVRFIEVRIGSFGFTSLKVYRRY